MANRRATLPLDSAANEAANEKLYAKFPELKGRPLSASSSADAKYREFWMNAYLQALSKKQQPVGAPPLEVVLGCPQTTKPGCGRSADWYKIQSLENIGAYGSSDRELNPAITKAYADLYKSDPATFKWAGMAAFASCEVGKAIEQAKDAQSSGLKLLGSTISGVDVQKLEKMLKAGNEAVYDDIAWQHLAYQMCGLAEIQKAYDDGQITDDVLQAWRKIDEGKSDCQTDFAATPQSIWEGNEMLLKYEQREILQKQVYDKDPALWKNASTPPASIYQGIDSPIPGDPTSFQSNHPDMSIGDFDNRWDWIENSMLPAWQKLDATGVDNVLKEMAPCLSGQQ